MLSVLATISLAVGERLAILLKLPYFKSTNAVYEAAWYSP